jgi:hypothetical protein
MNTVIMGNVLGLGLALRLVAVAEEPVWPVAPEAAVQGFVETLRDRVDAAELPTVVGDDGWLFSRPELRHLSVGPFWGEAALEASTATNEEWRDPVPAIVQFSDELKELGVELLLLPVPPKASIYADKLDDGLTADADGRLPRVDVHHQAFYDLLREQGVQVLDIAPLMLAMRQARAGDTAAPEANCQTDTHWSPAAIEAVAGEIARWVATRPWHDPDAARIVYSERRADLTITGDLTVFLPEDERPGRETFTGVRFVGQPDAPARPVEADRDSPVLLLGDSHTLVFSIGGEMHTTGAGLPDQLACELGMPVDLLGRLGSGATPTRVDLFRRARQDGYIEGKQLVIWCFRGMEFTENVDGWRPLPVKR